jgi:hypothetical protein
VQGVHIGLLDDTATHQNKSVGERKARLQRANAGTL